MEIQQGQFVEVRGRPWLVEAVDDTQPDLTTLRLSCIADDAKANSTKAAICWLWDEGVVGPRKPIVGSFAACCARAANGQDAGRLIQSPRRRGRERTTLVRRHRSDGDTICKKIRERTRQRLDERISPLRPEGHLSPPPKG
jgi:hypothetical protein